MMKPKSISTAPPRAARRDESLFVFSATLYSASGSVGMRTAAIRYASIPEPPIKTAKTHNTRTSVASILKYFPIPPHTPKIMRSVLERQTFRELFPEAGEEYGSWGD